MHPNPTYRAADRSTLEAAIDSISFARIFATTPAGPRVVHAPALRMGSTLRFHLANANALTKAIDGARALALFDGPNGYLSANWYDDVRGAVPTWNYVAVECEGPVRRLDRDALIALLDALAVRLEPRVGQDWTRAKMDATRFDAMLGAITAFELDISEMRGTFKLSQNQSDEAFAQLLTAFEDSGQIAIANAMRESRA